MENFDFSDIRNGKRAGYVFFLAKSLDRGDWVPILTCKPTSTKPIIIDGAEYIDTRYITMWTDPFIFDQMSKERRNFVIQEAIITITQNGFLVEFKKDDKYLNEYLEDIDNVELVKDVECFPYDGETPLDDEVMQKICLEKPTRQACLDLIKNGIPTLMSSANQKNALNREKIDEEKIYIGQDDPWVIGNGYAWIMLDWDDLDDDNKQYLISILEGKTKVGESSPLETIKFYEYVDVPRETAASYEYDSGRIIDNTQLTPIPNDDYYDLNKVYLIGHNSLNNRAIKKKSNHIRTVAIKYPLTETTTVQEVEEFYNKIVQEMIRNHNKNKIDSNQSAI